jgi:4-amino-4-deoxy-L-arabinose transferase-like glycosyltransferase
LLLLRALDSSRRRDFFLAGLVAGLALVVKQHGVFFTGFVGAYALYATLCAEPGSRRSRFVRLVLVAVGALTPFVLLCVWFAANGVFGEFFFWAFRYSATYGATTSLEDAAKFLRQIAWPILQHTAVFCGLAVIGLCAGVREPGGAKRDPARTVFLTGLFLFSALAVFPGLYFRHHYFLMVAPAVALLNAAAAAAIVRWCGGAGRSWAPLAAAAITLPALAQWAIPQRSYLFHAGPDEIVRSIYGNTPVVELQEIAEQIRSRSDPDDTLAVMGSEPQLYLYARRRPASSLIVMYPMMWAPKPMALELQQRTIREIEAAAPKFMVLVVTSSSWALQASSERLIIHWFSDYTSHYRVVGAVEMNHPRPPKFVWGAAAQEFVPATKTYVLVLERKPEEASE